MSIEFKLPEVSEGVKTADVSDVLVAEGDTIEAGQTVVEVETEKAVAPVECPHAGKVTKVFVSVGDTIEIGAPLLAIEEGNGAPAEKESKSDKESKSESANARSETSDAKSTAKTESQTAQVTAGTDVEQSTNGLPPAPAAPSARRLARELGVDLHAVNGSARGGRITLDDVQAFADNEGEPTGTGIAVSGGGRGGAIATPQGNMAPMDAPELPDFEQFGPITRQAMNKLARVSARNLSYAWATIPHVTQHDLADITDLEAARKGFMAGPGSKGPKITMTAIMVKAVVSALKQHPTFNSSLDLGSGEIIVKNYFHIGIAVDTEAGLVVPVIRDADKKTILEIASELTEIAGKARDRKLQMSDMQGGTFTITNLGGIGGSSFTPIVNYPEVAILGMSRGQSQLKLQNGNVVERMMLPLSLSYDHRVINGADAARFISTLSGALSDFMRLLVNT